MDAQARSKKSPPIVINRYVQYSAKSDCGELLKRMFVRASVMSASSVDADIGRSG
jgi:hypothetical protein